MHMNLATWWPRPLEECREHGVYTSAMEHDVFGVHERVAYVIGIDEPDAKDNAGGGYDKGLGLNARRIAHSGWQQLAERYDHPVPTWLNMDGTVRPLNWAVYGQVGDVNGFDPYPINFYGGDHAYVRESLDYARRCISPTRLFVFFETFGWAKGQGVPTKARGPLPAEYRQNFVQAVGAGMKGFSSWVYSAGAGGWQLNPDFAEEIARCNRMIDPIDDLLLLGAPVELASNDAGTVLTGTEGNEFWPKPRVWTGSLLCGPNALVVAVANHIPASVSGPPAIEAARNVSVSVKLPPFFPQVSAFEITEAGIREQPVRVEDRVALLALDVVESGRLFLLRSSAE
jgi:hypothetical protein